MLITNIMLAFIAAGLFRIATVIEEKNVKVDVKNVFEYFEEEDDENQI